jgi:hypothetical protein
MKVLTDWEVVSPSGLRGRVVEYTDEDRAEFIPLMDHLRDAKRDSVESTVLCESKQGT